MAACDLNELMPETCWLTCLSFKQQLAVAIVALCRILQTLDPMASCDAATLLADSQEYLFMSEKQMQAAQLELLCRILVVAGSGVVITTTDPVDDPGVESQIRINRNTGGVWYWNDTTENWVALMI